MPMINLYETYYYGMNLLWWFGWFMLLFWIFAVPYDIPGQRNQRNTPVDILRKRLESNAITKAEYDEKVRIIENDEAYYKHLNLP
jgi:putative membrane protein